MSIEIDPLTPVIGADIHGADLQDLTESQYQDIWQAFIDHSVIFFRDQAQLSPEQQTAFAQRFGEIHIHPAARRKETQHPGLMNMRVGKDTDVAAGNRWHSDVSCDAEPPQASILQLHTIPTLGGDTLFSSLYAAYDALSPGMKIYLDGLTAKHSGEEPFRNLFKFKNSVADGWPENDHPIVRSMWTAVVHRCSLIVNSPSRSTINPKTKAARYLIFFSTTRNGSRSNVVSDGVRMQSRSGTTGACYTMQCGITGQMNVWVAA
jgi:alpha-ketoglutarate-dependent taurine dioxygenase